MWYKKYITTGEKDPIHHKKILYYCKPKATLMQSTFQKKKSKQLAKHILIELIIKLISSLCW